MRKINAIYASPASAKEARAANLVCPEDRAALKASGLEMVCESCGRRYGADLGVISFVDRTNPFYEGAYGNQVRFLPRSERLKHIWPLWLINGGYLWMVRKYVPAGSRVLDLGCAGGVAYFGKRYRMIGCDLSVSALKTAANWYQYCIRADACGPLPLADDSLDAVISSYFWEHFHPLAKGPVLAECLRVLRPGGRMVFFYDLQTGNPLLRLYQKMSPSLYRKHFIDKDGHLGYQTQKDNIRLFEQAGFRVIKNTSREKTLILPAAVYQKLSECRGPGRAVWRRAKILGNKPFHHPYTALVRIVDIFTAKWLPEKWARTGLVVCEKARI